MTGILDPLDDAVLGNGIDDEPRPGGLDRLMVRAVDPDSVHSGDAVKESAGNHPDGMPGLVARVGLAMRQAIRDFVRDMLDQGAAKRDIQELLAAADPEHRHVSGERAVCGGELEGSAAVLGLDCRVPRRLPEQRRVDIEAAAGDDQAIDPPEIGRGGVGIVRQQDRQPAGTAHRIAIILADRIPRKIRIAAGRLVIEGEADDRLCHAEDPIQTERAMSEYYEQPLPIRTYDIDFAGIVSNIVFIRWLEDLRLGLLDEAYPLIRALAEDIAPILLSTRISYRRPVTIADPLVGRMRVAGLTRVRWRLAAEFSVNGAVHAEAEQEGLFMRLSTRRPIAIPEPIRRWHGG